MNLQRFQTPRLVFSMAFLIRLLLLAFGEFQDNTMPVKYTDIDYVVFSDASTYVYNGLSPYERSTYRYTPLLAFLVLPNNFIHKSFGKVLFVFCDLLIGWLLFAMMKNNSKSNEKQALLYACVWMFNPFAINVSTRGNAESVIGALVVSTLYFLQRKQEILSAILFGISIHFKIYPIIYSLAIYLSLSESNEKLTLSNFFSWRRVRYALITIITFATLTGTLYWIYGMPFLHETYLYHVGRQDPRHNFAIHFYGLYLRSAASSVTSTSVASASLLPALLPFLPQLLLILGFTFKFYNKKHLHFCLFCLTLIFVAFNKVCTVQYFIWYFCLLPLILPRLANISILKWILLFLLWLIPQLTWLYFAFLLEFKGETTFLQLFYAGIVFFIANLMILAYLLKNYNTNEIKTKEN